MERPDIAAEDAEVATPEIQVRRLVGPNPTAAVLGELKEQQAKILLLARRRGHRVAEVPVRWEDRDGTKVQLLRDARHEVRGRVVARPLRIAGQSQRIDRQRHP